MVRALRIIHLPQQEEIQITLERDGQRNIAPQVAFTGLLDPHLAEEIGWYFSEYLDAPFGPAKERAQSVEQGLRNFGRLLFESTFGSNEESKKFYNMVGEDELAGYQLELVSSDPAFLGLPWELLNEPERGYLTSRLASILRVPSARLNDDNTLT